MTDAAVIQDESNTPAPEAPAAQASVNQEPPKAPDTLLSSEPPADESTPPASATWPEDWREKYAGEDESKLNVLKRYISPQAMMDALFAARAKIQSGAIKTPLGDNPTPEEMAAYRKENGIPEKPEDYDTNVDGLVFGEDDKPMVDAFLKEMHAANATPEQVKAGLKAFHSIVEQEQEAQFEQDTQFKQQSLEKIREEWGQEYKLNLNLMKGVFDSYGSQGLMDKLIGGRNAEGNVIGNDPDFLRFMAAVARQINPVATVTTSGNPAAIDDELANLTKMMGDTKSEYWKGPNAEKNQARYRQLWEAKQKLK